MTKKNKNKLRKKTAFVFQNFNLFPHMDVLKNIIYTPIKVYKMQKDKVFVKAYELLDILEKAGDDAEESCQGNFYAILGILYENGSYVGKDVEKAVKYYSMGVEWNDTIAEYRMGRCYEKGIGVDVDLQKAKEYYLLAKEKKNSGAIEGLQRVEKLLNVEKKMVDDLPF